MAVVKGLRRSPANLPADHKKKREGGCEGAAALSCDPSNQQAKKHATPQTGSMCVCATL